MRMLLRAAGVLLAGGAPLAQSGGVSSPWKPLPAPISQRPAGFVSVDPAAAGILFTNRVPPGRYLTNQIYLNGSGVALGDVTGDGAADLFLAAPEGRSGLFVNRGGWTFADATGNAFAGGFPAVDATGAVLADFDGDGDLDLGVNTVGQGTWLWINDGAGRFHRGPPLNPGRAGMSLALADADADGDLDLYIANYRPQTLRDDPAGKFTLRTEDGGPRVVTYNGRSTSEPDLIGRFYLTPSGVKEHGEPDAFYRNDGAGAFTAVSWTGGAFLNAAGQALSAAPQDWGLSVLFRDLTGDGRPDLYVANDFESPDRLWINETPPGGPLRFRAAGPQVLRHTAAFAMGADAADINRDGVDDFLVLDMLSRDHRERSVQSDGLPPTPWELASYPDVLQFSANALYLGRGDGSFAEIGRLAGLAASEWSWTPAFLDVDLDGYEDVLISNGHELEMMDADATQQSEVLKNQRRMSPKELLELRRMFRRFDSPDAAFRNRGNLSFSDETRAWGFDTRNVTHGMALADLDGDGDLDVVQNNLNAPPTLLRNEAAAPRIAVRARAAGGNTAGIGTRLRVLGGPVPEQSQVLMSGGRYLSGDQALRVFAAGTAARLAVEATWPSGRRTMLSDVPANTVVELVEDDGATPVPPPPSPPPALFSDESHHLFHESTTTPFNDFERQPLLPWSLAYPGPGATWADLDGDGRDDLVLGANAGGMPAVFLNRATGFLRQTNAPLLRAVARDLTTLLVNGRTLMAGSSNYRDGRTNGGALRLLDLDRNAAGESVLGPDFAVGPLAQADVDGDGTLELFVGGRGMAGRYPEAAPSLLLRVEGGRFSVAQRWEAFGLVTSAVFADGDSDGDADLLVANEWGPLRWLRNDGGRLQPVDPPVRAPEGSPGITRLSDLTGWWTSLSVGDLDGDGRLDFLAGNRGWNWFPVPRAPSSEARTGQEVRSVTYADFDGNGVVDPIESYRIGDREVPLRRADVLMAVLPQLRDAFPTRAAFGEATLSQVLAALPVASPPARREARWFASTILLNRGNHFEAVPLPVEAQVAPVTGTSILDADGDGHLDLALAQNFYPGRPDESRQDAGKGLLLHGDGRGGFRTVAAADSGLNIWGDARALAVADYNRDGRADLVATQNSGGTKLYRNAGATPGIRVTLAGPSGNPHAVGAWLRLVTATGHGPAQAVVSGSGWLSVDSPSRVLTAPAAPTAVEVRWPGGRVTRSELRPGLRDVRIASDASLQQVP